MRGRQIITGRWEIVSVLGEGGMGDVYRGHDLDTGAAVAIKLLKPDIVDAMPDIIERFEREVQLLRQLDHPNIVKVLDAVEENDLHYLIMEYVPGGSLKTLLMQQGSLPVEQALEIALDLADALTRAHRLRIVHRDLKPANVLMAADGTPRLSDFGIARVTGSTTITQTGALVGTLEYVSPEACQGRPLDLRSDIWAFGLLLFEMLTGRNPFQRELVAATLTAILNDPVPDLEALRPDAPVELVDLVYRMLEKDPDYRIPSMRQVGAELEAILHGDSPAQPPGAAPRPPEPVRAMLRHDPGSPLTPFVGREADLAALDRLVRHSDIRLVTIAAPGGMGKTRLAMEYAARQIGKFPAGVYFIPLAGFSRVDDVVLAIADAVRFIFAPVGDRQAQLLAFFGGLEEQDMLLVLDNFEHMQDAAPLVSAILNAAPGLRLITTSRVRLNLSGETVFELGGMEIPDRLPPDQARLHGTVQLFEQAARRVQPGFQLKAAEVPFVLEICHAVFGNPLGIVLAAAWVEMLSVEEIAHEVAISLDFLQTDARDVPERQRSLRAVFESSWNMLSETERDVFMKLSIFQGGVKRSIAEYITRASLQTLASLVKKSLLRRDPGSGRYEVHELLRQYAAEELAQSGQEIATRDSHCHYFTSLIARRTDDLRGGAQAEAIREIDADFENVRAAWSWAVQRKNIPLVMLALEGLVLFALFTGEYDKLAGILREAERQFAPRPGEPPGDIWRLIAIRHELALTPRSDPSQIGRLLEMALAAGDRAEEAFARWTLAYCLSGQQRYADAVPLFKHCLALYQSLGDIFFTGRALSDVGLFSAVIGEHAESVAALQQATAFQEQFGDVVGVAQSQLRMALNLPFLIEHGLL